MFADNSVVEQPDTIAVPKIMMLSLVISIYAFGAGRHSTICVAFSNQHFIFNTGVDADSDQ